MVDERGLPVLENYIGNLGNEERESQDSTNDRFPPEEEKEIFHDSVSQRILLRHSASKGPLILIADDQMFLLDTLKMILADIGVESDIALGGRQAINMVKQRYTDVDAGRQLKPYKLIFMDYSMPILNGLKTTQQIIKYVKERGLDPQNHNEGPYICCLSAYEEQSFVERAYQAGMHNFMTKPAQVNELKTLLQSLFLLP